MSSGTCSFGTETCWFRHDNGHNNDVEMIEDIARCDKDFKTIWIYQDRNTRDDIFFKKQKQSKQQILLKAKFDIIIMGWIFACA